MEASLAYAAGKPFLSDEQYDELKRKLRKQNSRVVQQVRTLPYLGVRFKGVGIWIESCTGYVFSVRVMRLGFICNTLACNS